MIKDQEIERESVRIAADILFEFGYDLEEFLNIDLFHYSESEDSLKELASSCREQAWSIVQGRRAMDKLIQEHEEGQNG